MRWWHAQRNGVGGAPHHLLADLTSAEDAKLKKKFQYLTKLGLTSQVEKSFIWIISQNWVSRRCFKESAEKQRNRIAQSARLTARVSGTSRQGSLNFSLDRSSIYAIIRGFHRLSKEIPKADYKICILKVNLRNYLLKKTGVTPALMALFLSIWRSFFFTRIWEGCLKFWGNHKNPKSPNEKSSW